MEVNMKKSPIIFNGVEEESVRNILQVFSYPKEDFQVCFKYLGFALKSNAYKKSDRKWLFNNIENITKMWCNGLSRKVYENW
jgi:hypothetical protein